MIDPSELRKIVRFCQKNGIVRFKSGDFEIEIKEKQYPEHGPELTGSAPETFPDWESMTPEQKLLWSSTPDAPSS